MKKFSRDEDFNEHYIIKLDFYEPWSFKRRRKYLEIAFEFILVLKALMRLLGALMNIFRLVTVYYVLCVYLVVKDKKVNS
ncbi:uncharacterized protein OCT59_008555 [Rhizophagus irregularis]|uniref:uncharacterized protein n=1 Tax=Rhizophagus irregularis TaxID=588596 RepID=UPI000CB7796A|nr:hypothetical protein OCT59_008555 [Rhizophagus irregularis]GET60702.1 hypothetical protein RIR_jg2411.t1 [Rhizophagus irregularis DAOM 181602=DAOM 197198]